MTAFGIDYRDKKLDYNDGEQGWIPRLNRRMTVASCLFLGSGLYFEHNESVRLSRSEEFGTRILVSDESKTGPRPPEADSQ
jgi:hypothetical protein